MKDTLDFIVIGAQKAGTTSLFEYLKGHPELCLPPGKEAPYFSDDTILLQGWDDYMGRVFSASDPSHQLGTVTPHYMYGGVYNAGSATPSAVGKGYDERTVPLRIHKQLPEVRLIAILRDPVERARSHHQMAVINGLEHRSFDQAIDELLRPESLIRSREIPDEAASYVTWGEYGRILGGYFDVFSREQILVIYTDELERDPGQLLRKIYKFLELNSDFIPDNLGTRFRAGGTERRLSWLDSYAWLSPHGRIRRTIARNPVTRPGWEALSTAARQRLDQKLEYAAYRIDLINQRPGKKSVDEPKFTTLDRLKVHFGTDAGLLFELLGEMPSWQKSNDERQLVSKSQGGKS